MSSGKAKTWLKTKNEVAGNAAVRRRRVMFHPASDLNDGKPWTSLDFHNLKVAMGKGYGIEQAAAYLNRRGTLRRGRGNGARSRIDRSAADRARVGEGAQLDLIDAAR